MARYFNVTIAIALLLAVMSSLSFADEDQPGYDECKSKLDDGAPRCFEDVYFKMVAPTSVKCCTNYLNMNRDSQDCWDLLFDDPTSTQGLEQALAACKNIVKPPSASRKVVNRRG